MSKEFGQFKEQVPCFLGSILGASTLYLGFLLHVGIPFAPSGESGSSAAFPRVCFAFPVHAAQFQEDVAGLLVITHHRAELTIFQIADVETEVAGVGETPNAKLQSIPNSFQRSPSPTQPKASVGEIQAGEGFLLEVHMVWRGWFGSSESL